MENGHPISRDDEEQAPAATPEASAKEAPEDPSDRLRRNLKRIPMFAFIVFIGWIFAEKMFPGVEVAIFNPGPGEMHDVRITVKDQTRAIDLIAPGQRASVFFRIDGKARITLQYQTEAGQPAQKDMGEQVFNGHSGHIEIHAPAPPKRVKPGESTRN